MQSLHGNKPNSFRSQRRRALCLISLYLPVLILPWALTCIMMFRPIMKPTYINQTGHYSVADVRRMQRWNTAAKILDGIASVLAIPTVSTMLAYGAVIYTQRRSKTGQKELNIRQMLVIADKGWENIQLLWSVLWKPRKKRASPYLWFGFLLVLLGRYMSIQHTSLKLTGFEPLFNLPYARY